MNHSQENFTRDDINTTSFPADVGETLFNRPFFDAIDLYVTPIWYVLGVPGNILAFLVWVQRRMRPSSGCFLAALALDECLFLIMQVFFELQSKWGMALLQYPGMCQLFPVLFLTSQHLSPLLVLAFTTERYVSVCHPFARERFLSTRRPLSTIVGLVLLTLSINLVQSYFWNYNTETGECEIRAEVTEAGSGSVWSVWSWITELLIFGAVPLVMLILNVFVIRETQRLSAAEKKQSRSIKLIQSETDRNVKAKSKSNPSATTFMLLAVSFYVIATTLPVTVCYVLYLSFPEGRQDMDHAERMSDPTWRHHVIYSNVRTVVDEIGLSHYACNLYIYLLTGRVFRRELKRLVCGKAFKATDYDQQSRKSTFTVAATSHPI